MDKHATRASTTFTDLPPGPTLAHRVSFTPTDIPRAFDVVTIVLDFAPGAWTPLHSHGGEDVVLVLEGRLTMQDEAGYETLYGPGDSWIETAGFKHRAGNETNERVRAVFTIVLPEGAQLTTIHG